jgi:hypothetical protein
MLVMIDGEEVKVTNDIKIVYGDFDAEAPNAELHLTMTSEGMISDVIDKGEVVTTAADDVLDLADRTKE